MALVIGMAIVNNLISLLALNCSFITLNIKWDLLSIVWYLDMPRIVWIPQFLYYLRFEMLYPHSGLTIIGPKGQKF